MGALSLEVVLLQEVAEVLVAVGDQDFTATATGGSPGQAVTRVGRSRSSRVPLVATHSRSRTRAAAKS